MALSPTIRKRMKDAGSTMPSHQAAMAVAPLIGLTEKRLRQTPGGNWMRPEGAT